MVTALPPGSLDRIVERKAEQIGVGFLDIFEAGAYGEQQENTIRLANAFVPSAEIKLKKNNPFEANEYTVVTVPMAEYELFAQPESSPTHHERALRVLIPSEAFRNFAGVPAALWNDNVVPAIHAKLWSEDARDMELSFRRDRALDMMFREVDTLLRNGEFEKCNELLQALDVNKYSTNLLLGYLSITLSADDRLSARNELLRRVEEKLANHPRRDKLLGPLRRKKSP